MPKKMMASEWWTNPKLLGGYVAGGGLLLAMLPPETMGSGYYEFLRWVVFGVGSFWVAYGIKFPKNSSLSIGMSAAVIWNPILPFYLGRGVWFWLDLVFGLAFLLLANGKVPLIEEGKADRRENWEV